MSICELQRLNFFRGSLSAARRSLLQRLVEAGGSLAGAALSTRERSTAFRMTDAAAKLIEWNLPQNGERDGNLAEWTLSITDTAAPPCETCLGISTADTSLPCAILICAPGVTGRMLLLQPMRRRTRSWWPLSWSKLMRLECSAA